MEAIKTLTQGILYFADAENCRKVMVEMRWSDGVARCPYCGATKLTWLAKARVYRCYGDHPKQKFSLKLGTVFEDSAIGLDKWLPAIWLLSNCKNGISSYELSRYIGVTQKSAWFMLHRIRLAMESQSFEKLGGDNGPIEIDETFIGPNPRKMHADKREARYKALKARPSIPVMGMLDREARQVRAKVVPNVRRDTLQNEILNQIEKGSKLYTDSAPAYDMLKAQDFIHEAVNHVKEYVRGEIHT